MRDRDRLEYWNLVVGDDGSETRALRDKSDIRPGLGKALRHGMPFGKHSEEPGRKADFEIHSAP